MQSSIDKHSKRLIASNIELLLNYCDRFYDRQFITRDSVNRGVLEKFEELLNGNFSSEKPYSIGLPNEAYCAAELNFSTNYFGDLIKKETGRSAQEYLKNKIIEVAKTRSLAPKRPLVKLHMNLDLDIRSISRVFSNKELVKLPMNTGL